MSTDVPDHKVECGGCGTDITGRPVGLPCDACGDTRRRHLVDLHDSATATDSLSIGVEYVEGRPVRLAEYEKERRPTIRQEVRRPPVRKPDLVRASPPSAE